MKFRYNILIFIGRLLLLSLLLIPLIALSIFIIQGRSPENLLTMIFIFVIICVVVISLIKATVAETYHIQVDSKQIVLIRPFFESQKPVNLNRAKGYSISKVKYGWYLGMTLQQSRSLIVYTAEYGPVELVSYNYRSFDELESAIRKSGLVHLGHEAYKATWSGRRYQFEEKPGRQ